MVSVRSLKILFFAFFLSTGALYAQSAEKADSLRDIGEEYYDRGNYPKAKSFYAEAMNVARSIPDTSRWLKLAIKYAEILQYVSEYDTSLSLLHEIEKQSKGAGVTTSYKARLENDFGLAFQNLNHFDKAIDHYQKAIDLAESAKDTLLIGILYDNISNVYRVQGNYSVALNFKKKALPLFGSLGRDWDLALTLNNIGWVYMDIFMPEKALEYFHQALRLGKKMDHIGLLSSGYGYMGTALYRLGKYDQSLIAFNKALDYASEKGSPYQKSAFLNDLGLVYAALGESKTSLHYYQESLDLLLSNNLTVPSSLATRYSNIALQLDHLGNADKARENYIKALEIRKELGSPRKLTYSYLNMAKLEKRNKNYDEALRYAHKGKEISETKGISDLVLSSEVWLGRIKRDIGLYREALSFFHSALKKSFSLPNHLRLSPLKYLAQTYHSLESDSALYYGQQFVDIIEETRTNAGALSNLRASYFKEHSEFYVDLAQWYIKYRSDIRKAYKLVEASKARALVDDLAQVQLNLDASLPEEPRVHKRQLQKQIDKHYQQLNTEQEPQKRKELERSLRQLELEYAALMNRIHRENPQYKLFSSPSPKEINETQRLLDDQTAILEFAIASDRLLAFFITNQDVRVQQVDIAAGSSDKKELTRQVRSFRSAILEQQSVEIIEQLSDPLIDKLIMPFEESLSVYKNLIVVPDGALAYLPFEALMSRGQFLIERFNIKYAPSITSFSLLKEHSSRSNYKDLLAVAGSDFSPDSASAASSLVSRTNLYNTLPSTLAEVDSIASRFASASTFNQDNLTEHSLKEELKKKYRYIHLATHGVINEEYPNLSGLVISSQKDSVATTSDDGLLSSSEIYELTIDSEMVVLSACNTGLGKIVGGEGIMGLQRSFFYAGVSTVVVSLWSVYDRSTAFLMNDFYKAVSITSDEDSFWSRFQQWLGRNDTLSFGDKASAMRKAKLNMLRHPKYSHPIHWAPFIVVGR